MPASGKTSVARALSERLALPLVTKDGFKELLFDTLGTGDADWSHRLGDASYALVFQAVRTFLAAGSSLVVEANFFRGMEPRFAELPEHRTVQVHCHAPLDVLVERYDRRERHPGHRDEDKIDELAGRFASGAHGALDLTGDLVELDTSAPVDTAALAERVSAQYPSGPNAAG
jgi:predicted kinase